MIRYVLEVAEPSCASELREVLSMTAVSGADDSAGRGQWKRGVVECCGRLQREGQRQRQIF